MIHASRMVLIFFDNLFRGLVLAILFFLPVHTAYVFSFNPESSQYTRLAFTLLDFFILAALAVAIPLMAQKRIRFKLPRSVLMPLLFFIVIVFVSLFFAISPDVAFLSLVHVCEGVALFLIFFSGFFVKKTVAIVLVVAGVIQALVGMQQFFLQEVVANSWLGISAHSALTLGDSVVEGTGFRILRAYGGFAHPNMLAAFLGVSFFCSLYSYVVAVKKEARIASLAASMVILSGLLITFSRSVWLALAASMCMVMVLAICIPRVRNEIMTKQIFVFFGGVLAVVGVFTLVYWQPVSVRLGFQGNARLETRSLEERASYLQDAFNLISRHPLGIGIGQYIPFIMNRDRNDGISAPIYTYQPVHAHFVLILAELGFLGCISFLVFFFSLILYIFKRGHWISIAAVTFLFFAGLFDHYFWTLQSGVLLWWISLGIHSKIDSPR